MRRPSFFVAASDADSDILRPMADPVACSVEGCPKPARAQGLCTTHYGRKRREEKLGPDRVRFKLNDPIMRHGLEQLPPVLTTPEVVAALEAEAKRQGITFYRLLVNIIEEAAAGFGRTSGRGK